MKIPYLNGFVQVMIYIWAGLTIGLYLTWLNTDVTRGGVILVYLMVLGAVWFSQRKYLSLTWISAKDLMQHWPYLCMAVALAGIGLALYPLVWNPVVGETHFLSMVSALDYHKHLYVMTSIHDSGLPPVHPYDPQSNLIYYYGYYLIPVSLSVLTGWSHSTVLFGSVLLTAWLGMSLIYGIFRALLGSRGWLLLALAMVIFGYGLDLWPTLGAPETFIHYIEQWAHDARICLNLNTTGTAWLWVPQHVWSASVSLWLVAQLLAKKSVRWWWIGIVTVSVGLSSAFVLMSLLWALIICFWRVSPARAELLKGVILGMVLLLPFVQFISVRQGLLHVYVPRSYTFVAGENLITGGINFGLTYLVEFGLATWLLVLLIGTWILKPAWFYTKMSKELVSWLLIVTGPLLIIWIIRSPGPNDFGMRVPLMSLLMIPALTIMALKTLKFHWLRWLGIGLLVFNLLVAMGGWGWEIMYRWKDRVVMGPYESQMLREVRMFDGQQLMMIQNDPWTFALPVLGERVIYSPSLVDSGVYYHQTVGMPYESQIRELVTIPVRGTGQKEIITKQLARLSALEQLIEKTPASYLLLRNQEGSKQDISYWKVLFEYLGAEPQMLNDEYSLWNKDTLAEKLHNQMISINEAAGVALTIEDNQLALGEGLWLMVTCTEDSERVVRLEFENYYQVVSETDDGDCVGRLFYHPDDAAIPVTVESYPDMWTAYPIDVSSTNPTDELNN